MRFGYDYNISIVKIGFSYSFFFNKVYHFLLIANKKLLDRGLIFLGVD